MKTGTILFLAVFLGVLVVGGGVFFHLRKKVRQFSRQAFGTPDLMEGLKSIDTDAETTPRSLSGCDSILLPQILADFPDFDPTLAKTYARDALRKYLSGRQEVRIHNVVFSRYLRSAAQKTILMQAAVQYRENGRLQQKRYELHYAYVLQGQGGDATAAANCPNCGGAIGFGQKECPYCGSRVAAVLDAAWDFTEIREN